MGLLGRYSKATQHTRSLCTSIFHIKLYWYFYLCKPMLHSWSSAREKKDIITDQRNGQYSGTSLERFHVLKISFTKHLSDLPSPFLPLVRNFKGERKRSTLWKPHRWRSLQKAVPPVCNKLHFQAICSANNRMKQGIQPYTIFSSRTSMCYRSIN